MVESRHKLAGRCRDYFASTVNPVSLLRSEQVCSEASFPHTAQAIERFKIGQALSNVSEMSQDGNLSLPSDSMFRSHCRAAVSSPGISISCRSGME